VLSSVFRGCELTNLHCIIYVINVTIPKDASDELACNELTVFHCNAFSISLLQSLRSL